MFASRTTMKQVGNDQKDRLHRATANRVTHSKVCFAGEGDLDLDKDARDRAAGTKQDSAEHGFAKAGQVREPVG